MAYPGAPKPGMIPLDIPKKEEFVELSVCDRCGSAVIDTELHDRFHNKIKSDLKSLLDLHIDLGLIVGDIIKGMPK